VDKTSQDEAEARPQDRGLHKQWILIHFDTVQKTLMGHLAGLGNAVKSAGRTLPATALQK
jgi:hypothetical protein